jgi:hypothetical protein
MKQSLDFLSFLLNGIWLADYDVFKFWVFSSICVGLLAFIDFGHLVDSLDYEDFGHLGF